MEKNLNQPSAAYVGASWAALAIGFVAYVIGVWNTHTMELNEKGYYFTIIMYGLFSAIAVQKSVRDRAENIAVSPIFYTLCWISTFTAILLLVVGLYKAELDLSQKGFFGMSFLLSLFAAISVQKNTRDLQAAGNTNESSKENHFNN